MEKVIIGAIGSPVINLKKEVYTGTKIKVSYGGGMGGASQSYYIDTRTKKNFKQLEDGFIEILDIKGVKTKLNKNFIVSMTEVQIATTSFDVTGHASFNGGKFRKKIITEFYEIPVYNEVIFDLNKYIGDSKIETIHKITYTE